MMSESEGHDALLKLSEAFVKERTDPTRCLDVNVKRLDKSSSLSLDLLHRRVHLHTAVVTELATSAQELCSVAVQRSREYIEIERERVAVSVCNTARCKINGSGESYAAHARAHVWWVRSTAYGWGNEGSTLNVRSAVLVNKWRCE
jgi:hypothetical protein